MANIIKIKRGSGVPGSGVLAGYELGYDSTNNSLYLGVENSNPIKIADAFQGYLSINTATGKLVATNDLQVDGAVDFNSTLDITGNTTIGGTLNVTGLSTLSGGISTANITSSGNVDISGTLTVDGSSTLGDSQDDTATIRGIVNISDSGRTTTVKGALEVDEAAGFDGDVRVGAGGTSHFTVASASGNVDTDGTLTVAGATTLSSTLGVTGDTTLSANLAVTGTSTLTGNLTANGSTNTFNGDVVVSTGNDLSVAGDTSLTTVTASGLASLDGGIDVNAVMTVDAATGNIATAGDLTVDNATINGDLTVHGTTTTVNSTTVEISDPIFTLGQTLATNDQKDRGIEFNYGSTATPFVGFFGLDESTGRFTFIPDAVNTSEVFSGSIGDFDVNDIYQNGTLVSDGWNDAAAYTVNFGSAVQYDLLLANASGVFEPTKSIPAAAGITIDCGTY